MRKPKIKFVSLIPGLESIEECRPKPAKDYAPSWWKSFPKQKPFPAVQTIKVCPSFPQFFSQGYVVPMWADLHLEYSKETDDWSYVFGRPGPSNPFSLEPHANGQFIDHVVPSLQGSSIVKIFKLFCPWLLLVPKGYSVMQLPMFYEFNSQFSVFPGIIDADKYSGEINLQLAFYEGQDSIVIKRGTPLAQFVPIKREAHTFSVGQATSKQLARHKFMTLSFATKFVGSGLYNTIRNRKK